MFLVRSDKMAAVAVVQARLAEPVENRLGKAVRVALQLYAARQA